MGVGPLSRQAVSKICDLNSVAPELLCDTVVVPEADDGGADVSSSIPKS